MFEDILGTILTYVPIIIGAVIAIFFVSSIYTVVPPHEAHVVIQGGKGRNLYSSRAGKKSAYFALPIIQRRVRLPLRNKQLMINDIPLRDKNLAKFICDVVCWINIKDPLKAAERIGGQKRISDFSGVEDDIKNLIMAVTRNSSMKMDLVTLMGERLEFSKSIKTEVDDSISEWGIVLVDLECIHFQDTQTYTVIHDLEQRQAEKIKSTTQQKVAEQKKLADIAVSDALKETETTVAENEEAYKKQQLKRDEEVGKATQEKEMVIQEAKQLANVKTVEALRTLEVGTAEVLAEASVKKAKGDAEAIETKGRASANVVNMTGKAEASVVREKAFAEADGIDKKADAQKKYQEAGAMAIEIITRTIDASKDIEIAKYANLGKALEKATVSVVNTGEKSIFGIPVGADTGIALGGMFTALKEAGFDVEGILKDIAGTVKTVLKRDDDK